MKPAFKYLAIALLGLSAAGCQDVERLIVGAQAQADRTAAVAAMAPRRIAAGPFDLQGYLRVPAAPAARLTVYLESDGRAWIDQWTISADPTPVRPFVLEMAGADPAVAVGYVARPCQYQAAGKPQACHPAYWTNERFAPVVVGATDAAIDQLMRAARARELVLVGYSGGGVLAALVAARRSDIVGLVTVAAPLDHARWTGLHAISPLQGSLNPVDFAARLATIPQIHLVGARDTVVPAAPVESYVSRLPDRRRTRVLEVAGQTHDCCWVDAWRGLLAREIEPWLAQAAR
ncbi:MAG: alpha/beta hydrolase [Proteobacteria bacterium]|nr:alpha/beta hydrolase [Pseudomonadota bacterium]